MAIITKDFIKLKKLASPPPTPPAGEVHLWADNDGVVRYLDDTGTETVINVNVTNLPDLDDVTITNPQFNDVLWRQGGQWVNRTFPDPPPEGLSDYSDVDTSAATASGGNLIRSGGIYEYQSVEHMPAVGSFAVQEHSASLSAGQSEILYPDSNGGGTAVYGDIGALIYNQASLPNYGFFGFPAGGKGRWVSELSVCIEALSAGPYTGQVDFRPSITTSTDLNNSSLWVNLGMPSPNNGTEQSNQSYTMRFQDQGVGDGRRFVRTFAYFVHPDAAASAYAFTWIAYNRTNVSIGISGVRQSWRSVGHDSSLSTSFHF